MDDENSRFDGPDHMWASFRKAEERFWKDITVQPIHYDVLQWFGNEFATGQDAAHPYDIGFDDIDLADMTLGENDGEESDHRTTPRGRPASEAPRSTPRGMPASEAPEGSSSRKKKKAKTAVEKIASPFKQLANAFDMFVESDYLTTMSKRLTVALNAIPGLDVRRKMAAKTYFINNKTEAQLFLDYDDEEKLIMLEERVPIATGTNIPRNLFG